VSDSESEDPTAAGILPEDYGYQYTDEPPAPPPPLQSGPGDGSAPQGRARQLGGGRRPPRRRRRRRGHPVLRSFVVIVVLIGALVGGAIIWAQDHITPGGHPGPLVKVVIPSGSSTSSIAKILSHDGVIHDAKVFSTSLFALYVKLHNDGPLLAGTYALPKHSSFQSAIAALEAGPKILVDKLTIPEGYTQHQVADEIGALPHMGLSASRVLALIANGTVRSPYEPQGVDSLEGLLFPDTYFVRQGETEVDVLEELVGQFDTEAQSIGLEAAAAARHETPYQIITVASIVEREAKLVADRGPVASTIYNRLKIGMTLGADSTQTYYLRLTNPGLNPTADQLNLPSPYNTRRNQGLPPTPIANPGLPSLEAATSPPRTSYLYFVEINSTGQLGFASTDAGFVQLQSECRAAGLC
jgi:UPF0755 protein